MASKKLLCITTASTRGGLLESNVLSSLYEFSHRADGDRNAWLINWADAFVVGGFNDRHLLFFFWETGNGHSAADAGVPWHHRLSGDCFTALWIRKEAEKEETDVLVIQDLHKLQLNVCNG